MSEGAGRERWGRTSSVLAMLHNTQMGMTKDDMREPDHFNPYATKAAKEELIEVPIQALKIFCGAGRVTL